MEHIRMGFLFCNCNVWYDMTHVCDAENIRFVKVWKLQLLAPNLQLNG